MTENAAIISDEERLKGLNEVTTKFVAMLESTYGVEESVVAMLMPVTKGCELRVRVNGSSFGIVNMVSAIVQQLIPSDFATLLNVMQSDPIFSLHRSPTPIEKRHVN